jgi:hypothetical protein
MIANTVGVSHQAYLTVVVNREHLCPSPCSASCLRNWMAQAGTDETEAIPVDEHRETQTRPDAADKRRLEMKNTVLNSPHDLGTSV